MVSPASNSQQRDIDSAKSESTPKERDPITEKMKEVLAEPIGVSPRETVRLSKVEDQKSSSSPDLVEKALADFQSERPQPSELLVNKTFSSSLLARVAELKNRWKEPVLILSSSQAKAYCEGNDGFNEWKGTYVLSLDPDDPQTLHLTVFVGYSKKYETFSFPLGADDALKWEDKTYAELPKLISALSDKLVQPVCSLKGQGMPEFLEDITKNSKQSSVYLTYLCGFQASMASQQYATALEVFNIGLTKLPHSSPAILECFKYAQDNPETTKKMLDSLNEYHGGEIRNIEANEINAVLCKDHLPFYLEADTAAFQTMPESTKLQVIAVLYKGGGLQELERLCKKLDVKCDPIKILQKNLESIRLDATPLLQLIKESDLLSLLTPEMQKNILLQALKNPETLANILENFPEFHSAIDEKVYLCLFDNRYCYRAANILKNLSNLLKRKPVVTKNIISKIGGYSSYKDISNKLIEYIPDMETGLDSIKLFTGFEFGDQVIKVLNKFPQIYDHHEFIIDLLKSACKTGNMIVVCELINKLPSDTDKQSIEKILEDIPNQEIKTSRNLYKADWSKLYTIISSDQNKFPHLNQAVLKYHCIPNDDITMAEDILKASPQLVDGFFNDFARSTLSDKSALAWSPFIQKLWLSCAKKAEIGDIAINNKNLHVLKLLNPLELTKESFAKILRMKFDESIPVLASSLASEFVFTHALEHNDYRFLVKYLEADPSKKKEAEKFVESAMKNNCLSCALALGGEVDQIARQLLSLSPEEIEKKIKYLFLNSHSRDVHALMDVLQGQLSGDPEKQKAIEKCRNFVLQEGRNFARFPDPSDQDNMKKWYGQKFNSYFEQQENFAGKVSNNYQKVLQGVRDEDWSFIRVYSELFGASNTESKNLSYWEDLKDKAPPDTPMTERYEIVKPVMEKVSKKKNEETENSKYTIRYQSPEFGNLSLTKIIIDYEYKVPKWLHSNNRGTLLKECSALFDEIKQYPIPEDATSLPPELKKKIAKTYWLGVHAMPVPRGNSQKCLEIHTLMHELKGFLTAPPAQEYVLPDIVALCTDVDDFIENYYDKLFEAPPKRITQIAAAIPSGTGNRRHRG